jgi:nicotinamide/nicotinate riboside kinase
MSTTLVSEGSLTNIPKPFVDSKEDQNSVGSCPVPDAKIEALKAKVSAWVQPGSPGHAIFNSEPKLNLCLFDGFLLYCEEMRPAMELIDVKLFLTVSYERAKYRREARDGYVTLEGFWKDPPGYVDAIVWPNYVEAHQWLFADGDVQGNLREDVLRKEGILAQVGKGLDVDMETTLEWAVETVMQELEKRFQ